MKLSKASGVAFLVTALCLVFVVGAFGQAGTTSIYGDVKDQQGAVVVGANVTVTNTATNATRTVKTDSTGAFQFRALPPGTYKLSVEATGFRTVLQENLEALVDTPTRIPVTLEVGTPSETVEVQAAASTVSTLDSAMGSALSVVQVQGLPLEARNVVALLSLQTGAVFLPGTGDTDPRSGSVSGSRADQGNVTLDGVDVNDPVFNTAYESALRMTQDAVQEFKVTTSNPTAEQGRSSGAQVSLVTRSGTNSLHGSAYWHHRNTAFSSNEYFNKQSQLSQGLENEPPLLQKHIWGASLGGPIVKDRIFLFGNLENLREKSEASTFRNVPSNSFRDGILIYQCAGGAAVCPGGSVTGISGTAHSIAAGFYGLSPTELQMLDPLDIGMSNAVFSYFNQYPLSNDPGRDGRNLTGFRFGAPLNNQLWTYIARADIHVDQDANHKVFVRGNLMDDEINTVPQFPGEPAATKFLDNSRGIAIGYTGVLSSRVVNNFRYGFTRLGRSQAGLLDSEFVLFRFIDPIKATTSTAARVASTHNFVNDISVVSGPHTFQGGVNFRFTRVPRLSNANSFHSAVANGSWNEETGRKFMPHPDRCGHADPGKAAFCASLPVVADGDFASFADTFTNILGVINQANARYNFDRTGTALAPGEPLIRRFATNEYEFYIQDTWRLHSTFTLTLGLRYGLYTPPWETNGNQVAPTPATAEWFAMREAAQNAGQPMNSLPLISLDLAGPANNAAHYFNYDKNNFAPRFAFAWTPTYQDGVFGALSGNGRMVIRGGYGLIYDRVGHALVTQFDGAGSFGMSTSLSSPFGAHSEDSPLVRFVDPFTLPPTVPAAPPAGFPATPPSAIAQITSTLDSGIKTPYVHAINFAISREMPWGSNVEASYVGRVGARLLARRDIAMIANLRDPASGTDYFTAANQVINWQPGDPLIPYWENIFPGVAAASGFASTTEAVNFLYNALAPDYTFALWLLDNRGGSPCLWGCSKFGKFAFFSPQYDSLGAVSSVGYSDYHALQVSWKKRRATHGLLFDFNYTYAKGWDNGSNTETGSTFGTFGAGGSSGFLVNTWEPRRNYGFSDFDIRHAINTNWVWEIPLGRGRAWGSGMNRVADAFVGGWQFAGIWRWNTGLPFNVLNGRNWPTNWNITGNAEAVAPGVLPETQTTQGISDGLPAAFADPAAAAAFFRNATPGETGGRNQVRGDGFFSLDVGIGKTFGMPLEGHKLRFRWDIFNITNTAKFDTATISASIDTISSFGRYNRTYGACDRAAGRCMQVGLRYEF